MSQGTSLHGRPTYEEELAVYKSPYFGSTMAESKVRGKNLDKHKHRPKETSVFLFFTMHLFKIWSMFVSGSLSL